MSNIKVILPALVAMFLALAGQPAFDQTAQAQAKSVKAPQSQRALDSQPARELETYSDDIRLTNQCIDRGGRKAECLCVVQVLKYEMSAGEYRRAASGWSVPASFSDRAANPGNEARQPIRELTRAPDFGQRCEMAQRYFQGTRS